jgi:hypothetical protein
LEVLEGQRRVELGRPKQRALLAVLLVPPTATRCCIGADLPMPSRS